jgi:hypothetical protein
MYMADIYSLNSKIMEPQTSLGLYKDYSSYGRTIYKPNKKYSNKLIKDNENKQNGFN